MQICYRCHEYHDNRADLCHFCKIDTLIDAEIPEEYEDDCATVVTGNEDG